MPQAASRHGRLRRAALALALTLLGAAWVWVAFPFPVAELDRYPTATLLTDCEGNPLRMRLGPHDTDCRLATQPDRGHDWIRRALVAAEDRRFWSHPGVDPLALGRALYQNLRGRRVVSGASTLSTQVIRLMHPRRRTLVAKAIEMFRALQLERLLDKQAILEQYLNRAPFGANLIGIEAASRRYFGKAPADLSLAEAALLAGMPQSPTRFRPDRFPDRARKRQGYVLDRMLALGMITGAEHDAAVAQPIVVRRDAYPFQAPHFCDLLLESLPDATRTTSARVITTLDRGLQRLAEGVLRRQAAERGHDGVFGGAVVILEVKTGAVRALVGSPDYRDAGHAGQVNGAVAPRSAGSTLKPFAYALALDQGRITPGRMLADVPRVFRDYTPVNFDGEFNGLVTARAALTRSLNGPALALVEEEGVDEFLHLLRRLGFATLDQPASTYGLGLALGNGSVRLLDLANAYACLARGGEWLPYRLREEEPGRAAVRLFSAESSWLVAEMLGGDERAATTTGHRADVRLPRVAWKTGTSSGFRDAWVVGYNPDYVVAVWLGNADGHPSPSLVGATLAVPVMWEVMRGLYPANAAPWFATPAGIVTRRVCAASGMPAGLNCPATTDDRAIAGISASQPCTVHRLQSRVDGATGSRRVEVVEEWPREVAAYLQTRRAPVAAPGAVALRLVSPVEGTVCRKLEGFAREQKLPLKAEGQGSEPLYWFIDNRLVAQGTGGSPQSWPLERGRHVVVCCSASGHSARAGITVE